jgi:hypothetical protein
MPRKYILALLAASFLALPATTGQDKTEPKLDPATGMKMTGDWDLTRAHCIACHSPRTFLRQRATLNNWKSIIAWMEEKGGLSKLDEQIKNRILAYLSRNYAPGEEYRRAPIPATLMPENPYISETRKQFEANKR